MGTRIVITCLVAQTLAIGLLIYALLGMSRDIESISAAVHGPQATEYYAETSAQQDASSFTGYPSEDQLRRIIAEEISAGFSVVTETDSTASAIVETRTAEQSDQVQRVAEEIEYHISVGSISTADMEALQAKIATLDSAGRKHMLSKLVKAMNAGLIDGRL